MRTPTYEEVRLLALDLGADDRRRLAQELAGPPAGVPLATFAPRPPAPQSVAWLKAERGHAVLATDTGPAEADIPEGAAAIAGMWRNRGEVSP
jgi:hypothetical protein